MTDALFTHAQKTAGEAVIRSLGLKRVNGADSAEAAKAILDEGGLLSLGHAGPSTLLRYGLQDHPLVHSCVKFTVVRNPWDRAVSQYEYLQDVDNLRHWLWKYPTFDEWCEVLHYRHMRPGMVWPEGLNRGDRCDPQVAYTFPELDFLVRFESIQGDWEELTELLGVPGTELMHANKTRSKRPDYRTMYTSCTERMIGEVYAEDVARFGYDF